MTPTLSTSSLSLRPLTKATAQHVEWLNDPETVKFSEQRHHLHTPASVLRYVKSFDGANHHIWSIVVVETGRAVGTVTARIDAENRVAEVGILLGDGRGKGFGSEAWNAVCDWLLRKDGAAVRKVEAGCHANNTAMRRIMEKGGFSFEGEKRNHFFWFGQPIGLVFYGRFP